LLTTSITVIAVGAELATVQVLVSLAAATNSVRIVADVVLLLVVALASFYVITTNSTLVNTQGEHEDHRAVAPRSSLNHFADTSLAS
jgi:hypothetical protein